MHSKLFKVEATVMVVNYRLALHQHICPDNTMYRLGIVLPQCLIDMRHIKYDQSEIFGRPAPQFQPVLYRGLCEHPYPSCPGGLGVRIAGCKVKMADALKIDTAVGSPGIEYELPLYPIDLRLYEQVLGFRYFKLYAFVSAFF